MSHQIPIQESPPAWTQEAYHPPCSDYSFCCPNWVPPPSWPGPGGTLPGYPPSKVPPSGVPPWAGYPPAGYPTPPAGYPPRCLPHGILGNVAKHYGIWVPPPVSAPWHSGKCCKALWDMGTPPVDRQIDGCKDRRVSKHYLPVVLRTRAVIMPFTIMRLIILK